MDIHSGGKYPSCALSNFAPHPFVMDEVKICSMEGFLQSLKFKNPDMQIEVCKLNGAAAKYKGSKKNWKRDHILYWQGERVPRYSPEYQSLLDRAYESMARQSDSFRRALAAADGMSLGHSIGRQKESETILTVREFCSRLENLRGRVLEGEFDA